MMQGDIVSRLEKASSSAPPLACLLSKVDSFGKPMGSEIAQGWPQVRVNCFHVKLVLSLFRWFLAP
jgi:hypothetical protein